MLRYGVNLFGQREELIVVKELSKIQVPTLIIWGDQDVVVPASHGRRAAALIKDAKFHIISNAGHWPHVQHPEEFTEVIRKFAINKR
jgi:pimeloyl-ACP methyl ester carboxylesterase